MEPLDQCRDIWYLLLVSFENIVQIFPECKVLKRMIFLKYSIAVLLESTVAEFDASAMQLDGVCLKRGMKT